jgi:uncharacterized membrane protein YsdA (DUF1294 family)
MVVKKEVKNKKTMPVKKVSSKTHKKVEEKKNIVKKNKSKFKIDWTYNKIVSLSIWAVISTYLIFYINTVYSVMENITILDIILSDLVIAIIFGVICYGLYTIENRYKNSWSISSGTLGLFLIPILFGTFGIITGILGLKNKQTKVRSIIGLVISIVAVASWALYLIFYPSLTA